MDVNVKPASSVSAIVECAGAPLPVDVDIVIPVYNEQAEIGSSVMTVVERMRVLARERIDCTWQVVIADNASIDDTWFVARSLVRAFPDEVRAIRIDRKGRGFALKQAWGFSQAQVLAYMDVDLSTDLAHLTELIGPILSGRVDVAFGSRLMPASRVTRSLKRECISRTYNRMLQAYLGVRFHDAQCGFKALSMEAASLLLPCVADDEWFFDTELLYLSERAGLATLEIPVRWVEDPGSTVHIVDTVRKDLAGMRRLKRGAASGPGTRPGPAQSAVSPFDGGCVARLRRADRGEVDAR